MGRTCEPVAPLTSEQQQLVLEHLQQARNAAVTMYRTLKKHPSFRETRASLEASAFYGLCLCAAKYKGPLSQFKKNAYWKCRYQIKEDLQRRTIVHVPHDMRGPRYKDHPYRKFVLQADRPVANDESFLFDLVEGIEHGCHRGFAGHE